MTECCGVLLRRLRTASLRAVSASCALLLWGANGPLTDSDI
jgi:hypothetical protein